MKLGKLIFASVEAMGGGNWKELESPFVVPLVLGASDIMSDNGALNADAEFWLLLSGRWKNDGMSDTGACPALLGSAGVRTELDGEKLPADTGTLSGALNAVVLAKKFGTPVDGGAKAETGTSTGFDCSVEEVVPRAEETKLLVGMLPIAADARPSDGNEDGAADPIVGGVAGLPKENGNDPIGGSFALALLEP